MALIDLALPIGTDLLQQIKRELKFLINSQHADREIIKNSSFSVIHKLVRNSPPSSNKIRDE